MKSNRRNHYRILHVQPEAPLEIIRASYRTLMGTLRMHPDLGGDHETAALINTAWEVLSDPAKRAAFDRTLRLASLRAQSKPANEVPPAKSVWGQTVRTTRPPVLNPLNCPFCATPKPATIGKDSRCKGCSGPLGLPPQQDASGKELFGRRTSSRILKDQPLTVYATAQAGPLPARLQDLSISGASLLLVNSVQEGQVLRLHSKDFEALAQVLSVRRKGPVWTVGTRFFSVMFARQKGAIVSAMA